MSKPVRPPGLPTDVYRDVVTELLDGWDRIATSYEVRGTDIPVARIVFATTAAAYRQALAAHTLWKNDLWHESGPNVRYCFQAAIAAAWTQQTRHAGVEAAAYEFTQQNRRLIESGDKAKLAIADQARADILSAMPASKPALAGVARTFEQQCEALRFGSELYFLYRHLSGLSHPGIDISRHIVLHDSRELHVRQPLVDAPKQNLVAFTVACSLIWGHRAFAEVEKGKTDKPRLAKFADRLGIPRILYLTP